MYHQGFTLRLWSIHGCDSNAFFAIATIGESKKNANYRRCNYEILFCPDEYNKKKYMIAINVYYLILILLIQHHIISY